MNRRNPDSGVGPGRAGLELGVAFARLPVHAASDVDEAHARELATWLEGASRPSVLYRASWNRVGALYTLKLYVDGAEPWRAIERGQASGLSKRDGHVRERLGL